MVCAGAKSEKPATVWLLYHLTIYGASGALPIWIDTANTVLNSRNYKKNLQPADLVFNHLNLKRKHTTPDSFPKVMADVQALDDGWQLKRTFEPIN